MKKTILSTIVFMVSSFIVNAQWKDVGKFKNVEWIYDFSTGKGKIENSGKGLNEVSDAKKQGFLPRPTSGEVMIVAAEEGGNGRSSYVLNEGCQSCLTMVHTSGKGLAAASSKFSVKGLPSISKAISIHLDFKPMTLPENKKAIWYFVVGAGVNPLISQSSAPAITGYNTYDSRTFAIFRFIKNRVDGGYSLQLRHNNGTEKWGWQNVPGGTIRNNVEIKLDLFFNNNKSPQVYTINGVQKELAAESYHVYINGVQKGEGLTAMMKNFAEADQSVSYNGNLDGFSIMSREGADSGQVGSDNKPKFDNSASLSIRNLKVNYLGTAK